MESEEKEDLLVDMMESEEDSSGKEEIDCYMKEKIIDFIQREKQIPKSNKQISVIITCILMLLASSTLVVIMPIYLKQTTLSNISTYNKLVTVSLANVILCIFAHAIRFIRKCGCQLTPTHTLSLLDVLKVSLLFCFGSITIFWLIDGNYIRCHLVDPLKGSAVVFSLIFYYVFSKKKMSLERTFCAITVIVGIFVSVDFGICDKFHCNGVSYVTDGAPKLHVLYVLLCLFSHGIWVMHLTFIEVCWTSSQESLSVINIFNNESSGSLKNSIQSLSIICQEEGEHEALKTENSTTIKHIKKSLTLCKCHSKHRNSNLLDNSLINSMAYFSQLSLCDVKKFPITSTPKNEVNGCHSWSSGRVYDIILWQHVTMFVVLISFCWVATLPFLNEGKEKLLVDVIFEVCESFRCHLGLSTNSSCNRNLPATIGIFTVSYITLVLSSLELLKRVQSTITVMSIIMPALPVSSLFWSLFQMNGNSDILLEFSPQITGEAVCAVLGLPIIGIGIVLLMKSHFREFNLVM